MSLQKMYFQDPVYGRVTVEEPVLLDVITSPPLQRLRGVLQHGITGLIGVTRPVSRYEHSLGTMFLVRSLGASLEEQLAALLHDVSHTAFSHVIDYVFDDHDNQSYHDEVKVDYVARTGLPDLLARHGYAWESLLQETDYPLLEQPAPRLCGDRLDYFLRDSLDLGLAKPSEARAALSHLQVHQDWIATDHVDAARWLADTYMAADDASWANFREVGLYELAARAIRRGLALGVIDETDFWSTDVIVWEKLRNSSDSRLQRLLRLVSPTTRFARDEENASFHVSTKVRTIDPDVLLPDGQAQPLSALDPAFARRRARYLARKEGKWPIRVIPAERHRNDELDFLSTNR